MKGGRDSDAERGWRDLSSVFFFLHASSKLKLGLLHSPLTAHIEINQIAASTVHKVGHAY